MGNPKWSRLRFGRGEDSPGVFMMYIHIFFKHGTDWIYSGIMAKIQGDKNHGLSGGRNLAKSKSYVNVSGYQTF